MLTIEAAGSHARSGCSAASISGAATATARTAQSRRTLAGGCAGRASFQSAQGGGFRGSERCGKSTTIRMLLGLIRPSTG
jgi:ABC-type uncharacterized transport system ATPase subunit